MIDADYKRKVIRGFIGAMAVFLTLCAIYATFEDRLIDAGMLGCMIFWALKWIEVDRRNEVLERALDLTVGALQLTSASATAIANKLEEHVNADR